MQVFLAPVKPRKNRYMLHLPLDGLRDAGANARAGDDDFPRLGRRGSDSGADSSLTKRGAGELCAFVSQSSPASASSSDHDH